MHLHLVTLIVRDYDPAIRFFVDVLGFELIEDSPSLTNDGREKRWVVVRPANAQTGILLAKADGEHQIQFIGEQMGGRVGFFLKVENFHEKYKQLLSKEVEFVSEPRQEEYGWVAVFKDLYGNKWDLLG